ncbi:hypothetical protein CCC_00401 [Paramagnetospirillum magnetotacticum MS-1]|uniref:Uncharacterized protein n=1 Tax=Paramagnetospirillum magnetotacticum MS-1 TaxID=272627 RepID=A0A0C2YRK5_PARME|nr:hypothetical protein [Paramagnetospirillum magnetotacticum]KIL97340.1 hypothetical protein CCC_00401 [Paramagnetospirillum magnetotacticum MS-1]
MDASSVGAGNSVLYLQRAQAGLQAPLTAAKQEENAALAVAQVLTQGGQPAQQAAAVAESVAKSGAVGQVLDISV